jgi:hypothetical protein
MLRLKIAPTEMWDERKQEFVQTGERELMLEHSLVSLAKWESKWQKPFLDQKPKTGDEMLDYVRCMTITQNVSPETYSRLTTGNMAEIEQYISRPMTATTFSAEQHGNRNGEKTTAELIYYWMVTLSIPFECEKWHLNRLLALIRVCNLKNQPARKKSQRAILQENRALNAARRQRLRTRG